MANKVLVTGGTSLLGRRLPLDASIDFLKVGSELNLLESAGIDKVISMAIESGCDAILHLAWISNSNSMYEVNPENALWADKSIELAKKSVAAGLFFAGVGTGLEIDEANTTLYVASKRQVRASLDFELWNGLASWLRIFYVFDIEEHRPRLLASLFANSIDKPLVVTFGQSLIDYVSSIDASKAITAALRENLSGVIDIGSGSLISNELFIKRICAKTKNRLPMILENKSNRSFVANLESISKTGWRPVHTEELLGDSKCSS
jgi:nucleoside-diphosphate-sugar epimerase